MMTDHPQTIDLSYGKTSLDEDSSSYFVGKLAKPFKRESAATTGTLVRGSETSVNIGVHQHHGVLVSRKVQHKNGAIILCQVGWKRRGMPIREGSLFVRLRAGGPLISIFAKLPQNPKNVYGPEFQMFAGYGDILTVDDLKVSGFDMPRFYQNAYMDPEQIVECFSVRQIRPETAPRPALVAVSTSKGVEYQEMAQAPARRMRLGRRT